MALNAKCKQNMAPNTLQHKMLLVQRHCICRGSLWEACGVWSQALWLIP